MVEKSSFRLGSKRSARGAGGVSGVPLVDVDGAPFSYGGGRVSSLTPWVLMIRGMDKRRPDGAIESGDLSKLTARRSRLSGRL
jgi:hypothetical protein